jgi:hypothetical protein
MDAGTLHKEIAKVCPVISVKVGKPDDRATWSFKPKPEATQGQKDAGNNVIATIPVDPPPTVPLEDQVLFDHENRLRALEGTPPLDTEAFLAKRPNRTRPRRQ